MAGNLTERIGFGLPDLRRDAPPQPPMPLELITSTALALSTVLVAIIVTIGVARADNAVATIEGDGYFQAAAAPRRSA